MPYLFLNFIQPSFFPPSIQLLILMFASFKILSPFIDTDSLFTLTVAELFSLFERFALCFPFFLAFFLCKLMPFSFFQSDITSQRNFHNFSKKFVQKISMKQNIIQLALEFEDTRSLTSLNWLLFVKPWI